MSVEWWENKLLTSSSPCVVLTCLWLAPILFLLTLREFQNTVTAKPPLPRWRAMIWYPENHGTHCEEGLIWDCPGGPVKTLCSHYRGHGFDLWLGNQVTTCHNATRNKYINKHGLACNLFIREKSEWVSEWWSSREHLGGDLHTDNQVPARPRQGQMLPWPLHTLPHRLP